MEFKIEVNNRQISVREGDSLLTALRGHGFKIPTLCHMNRFSPTGACRLCVVEVEGKRDLITSCSYPVEEGMKVMTNSQRVIRARKSLVELLLSNHPDDCLYCQRNGNCELQWLAEEMNVRERKYFGEKNTAFPDYSSTAVAREPAKCVLCSRCVRICEEVQLVTAVDFISRGNQTKVNSAFHKGLNVSSCIHCGQCVQVCPTAALLDISHIEKVQAALAKAELEVVFFISPSVAASVAEHSGLRPKQDVMGRMVAALKRCGASRVFDLGYANDINILAEARLLAERIRNKEALPLLSSCCPAWVRYAEEFRQELLPRLAGVKSPQQILGSLIKTKWAEDAGLKADHVFTVSVMPCLAKKYEASREENTHKGVSEVDAVLTVREFFRLLRSFGLEIESIEEEAADPPFHICSASAFKLGYSGGKAEAVARETFRLLGGSPAEGFRFNLPKNTALKRETKVSIGDIHIGFAWASSISEAEAYLNTLAEENRSDIHYVEVMACLEGCAGGGGQPVSRGFEKTRARRRLCADMEKNQPFRAAGEHPGPLACFTDHRLDTGNERANGWLKPSFKKRKGPL